MRYGPRQEYAVEPKEANLTVGKTYMFKGGRRMTDFGKDAFKLFPTYKYLKLAKTKLKEELRDQIAKQFMK